MQKQNRSGLISFGERGGIGADFGIAEFGRGSFQAALSMSQMPATLNRGLALKAVRVVHSAFAHADDEKDKAQEMIVYMWSDLDSHLCPIPPFLGHAR